MREGMKELIADTFSDLLGKEDIDKITVTKLIEACQISRQTFYYHFHDIMDVLEWTFKRAAQKLVKESIEAKDRFGALQTYVLFVRENRSKLEQLIFSKKWIQIEGILVESVMTYLEKMTRCKVPDLEMSYEDMEVTLRFYASGMIGVLIQYVGKNRLNEEKLVKQIERIISGDMLPIRF